MLAIFLDIETTGLDPFLHRAVEIAFKIVDVHTSTELVTYHRIVKQPQEVWDKRDLGSVAVNGFSWEKLQQGVDEKTVGQEIVNLLLEMKIERGKAVYICQNPAFDRSFFSQLVNVYIQEQHHWPYHWLDFASMFWALRVKDCRETQQPFPKEMSLSKNSIAEYNHLPIESTPHSALNGVNHLIMCYQTVVGFMNTISVSK